MQYPDTLSQNGASIIIPTYNRESILAETIECIFKSSSPVPAYEVIIVNDGEPFAIDIPGIDKCCVLNNSGKGAASARNKGAAAAKYPILIFLDDDMLVSHDNIRKHLELHMELEGIALSGVWVYNQAMRASLSKSCFGRYKLENDYKTYVPKEKFNGLDNLRLGDSLASFNFSIRKEVFDAAGGFDDAFPFAGCEDQEFSFRLAQRRITLLVATDFIAYHNERDRVELGNWLNRQYTGIQGMLLLAQRNPERRFSPLFAENSPINWEDSINTITKKVIKTIFYNAFFASLLLGLYRMLDRLDACEGLRHYLIRRMEGIYIYRGFRLGWKQALSPPNRRPFS